MLCFGYFYELSDCIQEVPFQSRHGSLMDIPSLSLPVAVLWQAVLNTSPTTAFRFTD